MIDLRVAAGLALMNSENRQLAYERIGGHLEHVRQQRLGRVVADTRTASRHFPTPVRNGRGIPFQRAWEVPRDRVEQLADAQRHFLRR